MAFTWETDIPSGVSKNHALSSKLRSKALQKTIAMQFVAAEPGYGKKKGESITVTRVSTISEPTNARLSENRKIPEDTLSMSTVAITVSEWGRAVHVSSLAQDLSKFDPKNIIQRELMRQMRVVLDTAALEAMTSSSVKVKAIPTGEAALTMDTDGTASTAATSNLRWYHMGQLRDYLFDTLKVPGYNGSDEYVMIAKTKAVRGLKDDPNFDEWKKYTDPSSKFNSEIGKIESIRVVETNAGALSSALGTNSVLGEAVVFGEDFCAMAVAQDPELRAKASEDFGRSQAVAWYGILEFGIIWDTANAGEARGIHVTSS